MSPSLKGPMSTWSLTRRSPSSMIIGFSGGTGRKEKGHCFTRVCEKKIVHSRRLHQDFNILHNWFYCNATRLHSGLFSFSTCSRLFLLRFMLLSPAGVDNNVYPVTSCKKKNKKNPLFLHVQIHSNSIFFFFLHKG